MKSLIHLADGRTDGRMTDATVDKIKLQTLVQVSYKNAQKSVHTNRTLYTDFLK